METVKKIVCGKDINNKINATRFEYISKTGIQPKILYINDFYFNILKSDNIYGRFIVSDLTGIYYKGLKIKITIQNKLRLM